MWQLNFFSYHKRLTSGIFFESLHQWLFKTCDMPSFLGIEKFNHHLTYPHPGMVTKFFQSPSNTPTPLMVIEKNSVISPWCRCVKSRPKEFGHHLIDCHFQMVIKFFRLPRKGVMSYVFVEGSLKTYDTPPFRGDWNILITIKRGDRNVFICRNIGDWNFSIIARLVIDNLGCHKVWQLKKIGPHILCQLKIILVVVPYADQICFQLPQCMVIKFFQSPQGLWWLKWV